MKERVIKIGILSVVFILAVIGFSYLINRGNAGTTVDMGNATLPTISFQVGGKKVNMLVAHKKEMNIPAMRDTIVAYDENEELNFKTITDETSFYVNEKDNVVICFNEGEVAPMYMGAVEFEIPADVLSDIRK